MTVVNFPVPLEGKFDRSVSMLAWAYNEEELIATFLKRALALLDTTVDDWELIVVDDASTDRTPDIIANFAKREPRIRLVRHQRNLNVGWACRTAIAHAQKEFLFWETIDWSYDLTHLRIFLELLKYFDVVQGVRPVPEGIGSHIPFIRSFCRVKSRSDNLKSAVVSLGNYYHLRLLYGVPFHDFQNVTFYPTHLAKSLDIVGTSSFVNPEMLIKAYSKGARFIEVPIRFIKRTAGEAKGIKLKAVVRSVKDVWLNWFRWGLTLRLRRLSSPVGRIYRVAEPFCLDERVLALVLPLFKEFQRSVGRSSKI